VSALYLVRRRRQLGVAAQWYRIAYKLFSDYTIVRAFCLNCDQNDTDAPIFGKTLDMKQTVYQLSVFKRSRVYCQASTTRDIKLPYAGKKKVLYTLTVVSRLRYITNWRRSASGMWMQ